MYRDRVRLPSLLDKVMSAAEAADLIQDGMTVGMSGFTRAGEAKAVPQALAMRAKERPLRISLMTGASLGNDLDKQLTEAGVLARRMPFQVDSTLRKAINAGEVMFIDQHLSETVEQLRNHQLKLPDIAVIEAAAITEQGHIVPTTSVGNSASFAIFAKQVIVEINLAHSTNLEGLHDIYIPVMCGLIESPFENLTMYSEVLQDSTFDLIDAGKLRFASGSSITLSPRRNADVFGNLERYKDKLVLRPQEISNHPEVVRRLGIIGINTALEFDIYGNVNSTHVGGTKMMNGIGGSGDFARNAHLAIFVTKSIAKGGNISSVVPMVSHVDHTEHDVDILVTEQGLADLRGLAPRERARVIIENCVHPSYQAPLLDYFEAACAKGGHTPHLLREALAWHLNLEERGHMLAG